MKQESKRERGHYWVIFEDREQVAYYYGVGWQITGCLGFLKDHDFQEIDERKIERHPKPKEYMTEAEELEFIRNHTKKK